MYVLSHSVDNLNSNVYPKKDVKNHVKNVAKNHPSFNISVKWRKLIANQQL